MPEEKGLFVCLCFGCPVLLQRAGLSLVAVLRPVSESGL